MGLPFSVRPGLRIPPPLVNIFRELFRSKQIQTMPTTGDLTPWAKQGVLMLNRCLTVDAESKSVHRIKIYGVVSLTK